MNKNENPLFYEYTYKFLHEYLVNQLNRSKQTEVSYTDALTLLNRYSIDSKNLGIDKLRFSHITKDFILDFRIWLLEKQKNKPQTVNQRIAAINSYLSFATSENISLSSIRISIANIPRLRTQKPKVEGISVKALKAIFDAIPNTKKGRRDLTLLVLLYDSGARISEILNLKMKAVQLNQQYSHLHLLGKGNKFREVPLSIATVKLLKNYIKEFKSKNYNSNDFLFQIVRNDKAYPLSYDCVNKFLKKYGEEATKHCCEVPNIITLHKFRHAKALHMVENGIPLPIISKFLGHENISTTMIYGEPTVEMIRQALKKAENFNLESNKKNYREYEKRRLELCGIRK